MEIKPLDRTLNKKKSRVYSKISISFLNKIVSEIPDSDANKRKSKSSNMDFKRTSQKAEQLISDEAFGVYEDLEYNQLFFNGDQRKSSLFPRTRVTSFSTTSTPNLRDINDNYNDKIKTKLKSKKQNLEINFNESDSAITRTPKNYEYSIHRDSNYEQPKMSSPRTKQKKIDESVITRMQQKIEKSQLNDKIKSYKEYKDSETQDVTLQEKISEDDSYSETNTCLDSLRISEYEMEYKKVSKEKSKSNTNKSSTTKTEPSQKDNQENYDLKHNKRNSSQLWKSTSIQDKLSSTNQNRNSHNKNDKAHLRVSKSFQQFRISNESMCSLNTVETSIYDSDSPKDDLVTDELTSRIKSCLYINKTDRYHNGIVNEDNYGTNFSKVQKNSQQNNVNVSEFKQVPNKRISIKNSNEKVNLRKLVLKPKIYSPESDINNNIFNSPVNNYNNSSLAMSSSGFIHNINGPIQKNDSMSSLVLG
ncbi:hypothetical protein BB559_004700 [Furculomyces boomerangus]|uniref:Uncharacterized protein n=2 Tax=Harpellales TaxID=61421 RepID=A0A2T9YD85_9FUNG|nr:hypothetical protein BB559_004700 [Furculomyces boomerangus]PWA03049.1 hypothetical protein BB558_000794 [Smittium angustum]